jgi:hypothetical protein
MKSIQMMLYTYFKLYQIGNNPLVRPKADDEADCSADAERNVSSSISSVDLVNASCKLKFAQTVLITLPDFIEPCIPDSYAKYKKTKESSIQYTKELLRCSKRMDDLNYFNKFKKKDDLADTLLQGLFYANKHC